MELLLSSINNCQQRWRIKNKKKRKETKVTFIIKKELLQHTLKKSYKFTLRSVQLVIKVSRLP